MLAIEAPLSVFPDLDGSPLDAGYVYLGDRDDNPETAPVAAFWDASGTQQVAYPLRTSSGFIVRNGSPAAVYTAGEYSITVRDKFGRLVITHPNSSSFAATAQILTLADTSDSTKGDAGIGVKRTMAGAVAKTLHDHIEREMPQVSRDLGITADGSDQTSAILAKLGALGAGVYIIPYGVKFAPETIVASLATNQVLLDFSGINDYSSAGETNKSVGILTSDTDVNDTHFHVSSGHHAVLNINSYGLAGTTSATERKATIAFSAGKFTNGSSTKRGYRSWLMLQASKDGANNFWSFALRQQAPWVAIANRYGLWTSGEAIASAGVYRSTGDNHYVSDGAGTCGSTMPTHTSGSATDGVGGVSWTHVDSGDRTIFGINQYGRFLIGAGSYDESIVYKVAPTDPSGVFSFHGKSTGVSKVAALRLTPTNGGGAETLTPYLRADASAGMQVMKSDGSAALMTWSDAGGLQHGEIARTFATAADNDTTPSAEGLSALWLANTSPTSITTLDDGSDGQEVELYAANANTTLVHSSTFRLTGSANIAMTAGTVVKMRKIPQSLSANSWWQVAGSVK